MKGWMVLVLGLAALPLCASPISFSGGYTRMRLGDAGREIVLTEGAEVRTDTLALSADTITLSGEEYDRVACSGNVEASYPKEEIVLRSPELTYVQSSGLLTIQSWIEVVDDRNDIAASAGNLRYELDAGVMTLESHVRLMRATDRGTMACTCDRLAFDRAEGTIRLAGAARIDWDGDTYQAQEITVDLDTEEIVMDGSIKGTVHG